MSDTMQCKVVMHGLLIYLNMLAKLCQIYPHSKTLSIAVNTTGSLALALLVVVAFFSVTRLHMLHSTITRLRAERKNEAWLLEQCKEDAFYHNLKQHSTLCDDVNARAEDALLLHAVREVIENTYICNFDTCVVMLDALADFCARYLFYLCVTTVLLLVLAPTIFLPFWRRIMNRHSDISDIKTRQLYNCPYGEMHYVGSHDSDYDFRRLQQVRPNMPTNVPYTGFKL